MNLDQIRYLRELHGNDNLFIFMDNAKLCNTKLDKTNIIWDDKEELIHTIRPNPNFYSQSKEPIVVESSAYDTIQYIGSYVSKEGLTKILDSLKKKGLIDDKKISMILSEYKK